MSLISPNRKIGSSLVENRNAVILLVDNHKKYISLVPDVLGQLLVDNLLHHAADALDEVCDIIINPLSHGEGGGALYATPSLSFCLLLKIIMRHPYLKFLTL